MKIRIANQQRIYVDKREIRDLVGYALKTEGINRSNIEISVLLVDNAGIKKLNKRYLGRARPTDVISFRMWEGPFYKLHPEILGDVVVNVELAKKAGKPRTLRRGNQGQGFIPHSTTTRDGTFCKVRGKSFKMELALYVVHGLLHLLGYIDDTKKNAKLMNGRCRQILAEWL